MAGITRMVDDQIKVIRKERAELDELKEALERKEHELREREGGDFSSLEKDLDEARAEIARLRESAGSFEDDGIAAQIQHDIDSLSATKGGMERQIERLAQELTQMQRQKETELARIREETEEYANLQRAEREDLLKEIAQEHSMDVAALEQKKTVLESEITALEQQRDLEWEKVHAEISRYKTTQKTELEARREQALTEIEEERAGILNSARETRNQLLQEFAEVEKAQEREINDLELKKQSVIDETELLQFEYEKAKAENVVKLEKYRAEEQKLVEEERVTALAKLEEEKQAALTELESRRAEMSARLHEERAAHEKAVADFESKKHGLQSEINLLYTQLESVKAENETSLESQKAERLREIDELRLQKLQEVEDMRQARMADLERVYFNRIDSLEQARNTKLENSRAAVEKAAAELDELKAEQKTITDEIARLEASMDSLQEENELMLSRLQVKNQQEMEALSVEIERKKSEAAADLQVFQSEKMKEIEDMRLARLKEAETRYQRKLEDLEAAQKVKEDQNRASTEAAITAMGEMERLNHEKQTLIMSLQEVRIEYAKQKSECEQELESYRSERMREAEDAKLTIIREAEELRQERMAELETAYFEKMDALEAARNQRLTGVRRAVEEAEAEAEALKQKRRETQAELENLKADAGRIRIENEALQKRAVIERKTELERLSAEKLDEIEALCAERQESAQAIEQNISKKGRAEERAHKKRIESLQAELMDLERQKESLTLSMSQLSNEQLAELEEQRIAVMDELSRLKLDKMKEIEEYLEQYRDEKMRQVEGDFEKQMNSNYKRMDELAKLNEDYEQRAKELEELSLSLQADKRSIFLKEKMLNEEQNDYKELIQSEMQSHRREMALIIEAKEQQISFMEEKLRSFFEGSEEIEQLREQVATLQARPTEADMDRLHARIADLEESLENLREDEE